MQTHEIRNGASIKPGPLIALAAVALGVALYYWKFTPIDRQLSAEILSFEVIREPDDARTPPFREALAATVSVINGGEESETILKARFLVSQNEDLSDPRSWSPTIHRDAMLLNLKIPGGQSNTHTFVIPWTGREEARFFPSGVPIYLGFSIQAKSSDSGPITLIDRFGHVIQERGRISHSDHDLVTLEFPK
jgi:hypothetical protein